ncbi:OLC1v1029320C1 [Oldenlandia corymbosa var. corymbosa]|uniref:OLC1v1029320C1 n=1 Tax=Oldenlandia corymbosa var. corymbosa TaxID=529605 RepID=A0AAV1CGP9_OLDCO|nr:OLC1v1029320C1 [Oldenlandia corymbosa var. corymbosa]
MEELKEAAIKNDVEALARLLQKDKLILDRLTLNSHDMNPLHIAAMFGHVEFVQRVLLASPDLCLAGDRFRRIPLHLAIIKGKLDVVRELVHARPISAREKIDGGGNALHLCVKYNQLAALKLLIETIKDDDFVNRKDDDGMTILHLAICDKQTETIKYLLGNNQVVVHVNVKNSNGSTPLDLFQGDCDPEIGRILHQAGARRGRELLDSSVSASKSSGEKPAKKGNGDNDWLSRKRDAIMVVASLIATMAFQAGVSPTGGVWQDDSNPDGPAGTAVMALKHPKYYKNFVRTNTVAFVSSLSTILFLISGLPFRYKFFMWALMVVMWLTITAIASTYGISILMVTPVHQKKDLSQVIKTSVTVWCGVMSLLLLGNTIRLINRWIRKRYGVDMFRKLRRQGSCSAAPAQSNGHQGSSLPYVSVELNKV